MSWDSIFVALLLLSCVALGMFLGAFITARALKKSMIETLDDVARSVDED